MATPLRGQIGQNLQDVRQFTRLQTLTLAQGKMPERSHLQETIWNSQEEFGAELGKSRSPLTPVSRSEPKASVHSLKGRLLVTSVALRS